MAYFPMFVDISKKPCLIVGGGKVAFRKVAALFDFGAKITVISPKIIEDIKEVSGVTCIEREFQESDIKGQKIVVAATDSRDENCKISEICKQMGIMVNVVDQLEDCSFIFPAYLKQRDVVAAFTSSGKSPVISQYMKLQNDKTMTPFLGEVNEFFGMIRKDVIEQVPDEDKRKLVYEDLLEATLILNKLPTMEQVEGVIAHILSKE
ncbi:precorrin-2 dehydrogenase / sirohydrochlorin ferrochelatase [Lachnospiraceae bacterium C7]|nr:precorrin-2 dehydrogenase / sirohydrochlorin ferrochelatase [Lachnospiraceae bacterium C7]